jgi:hypothetical protein
MLSLIQPHPSLIACFALGLTACAMTSDLDVMIQEDTRGAVYLERLPNRSFEASHPVKVEEQVIVQALQGLMVQDTRSTMQMMFASKPIPMRVFSDEDVAYLAPLIVTALSRAASDQQVGFRIVSTSLTASYSQRVGAAVGSSEPPLQFGVPETTSATVFVHGLSLHLSLSQYRYRAERANTINMPNRRLPDPTGLNNRVVVFMPDELKRPDSYRTKADTETSVVIDYELLAKLPALPPGAAGRMEPPSGRSSPPAPSPTNVGSTNQELQTIREQMDRKDAEVEGLRKELEDIRRELKGQQAEREKLKQKSKPVPKPVD